MLSSDKGPARLSGFVVLFALLIRSGDAGAGSVESKLAEIPSLYMNARFEDALALAASLESERAADPLPVLLRVHALFWQYEYEGDPAGRWHPIVEAIDETIRRSSVRLRENPNDAEAEFCWGLALLQRSRVALEQDLVVSAGSFANAGNVHLERAEALRPHTAEYRFGLGLYQYFGAQIPKSLKLLQWLWFVPNGDREVGLAHLEAAAASSALFGADAQATLLVISYGEDGDSSSRALDYARRLSQRFPADRLFEFAQLPALLGLHRYHDTVGQAERLIALPIEQKGDRLYRGLSYIWLARAQLELGNTSAAERTIVAVPAVDRQLSRVDAWCAVVLGQIDDVRGNRSAAVARYRQVLGRPERERSYAATSAAQTALETPFSPLGE
jgi:hypothetical protein